MTEDKFNRMVAVNTIMKEIASRGRNFFACDDKIAELVLATNGKVYYRSEFYPRHAWSKELICLSIPAYRKPKGWNHGGTLQMLVIEFRDFIKDGKPRERSTLYSPHWGYPEADMEAIRELATSLGFLCP